jgi:hypothetical protein
VSLQTLTWKQLPTQTVASGSTAWAAIADAIYTAFASTTYADGTSRSPGTGGSQGAGVAWSPNKYQNAGVTEAVWLLPGASTTTGLNPRIVFAGSAGTPSPSPTMGSGTSFVTNAGFVGLSKNGTSFTTWNATATGNVGGPFGASASWLGYNDIFVRNATYATTIRSYESQDAIVVTFEYNSVVTGSCIVGCFIDPESSDTTNDAETDGHVYSQSVNQQSAGVFFYGNSAGSVSTTNTVQSILNTVATATPNNGYCKWNSFKPGTSTSLLTTQLEGSLIGATLKTRSGKNIKVPILAALYNTDGLSWSATPSNPSVFIGRVREIWCVQRAANGTLFRNSGTDIGYLLSANSSTTANATLMLSR